MNTLDVRAGDILVSDFFLYQHWSIVSDRCCDQGFPMLISATKRNNTVQEETWEQVTQGKRSYIANVKITKPVSIILEDARSKIGVWSYSVTSDNCEHFVKWASNLEVTSVQVKSGVSGAIAGVALVGAFSKKPNVYKFLGAAVAVAGLAIIASKA